MITLLALSTAAIAPAILITLIFLGAELLAPPNSDPYTWARTMSFMVACLSVSSLHVLLLGIPAFALLRWKNAVRWWSTIATGFFLAAVPIAVVTWPLQFAASTTHAAVNGTPTMVNGLPTVAGWVHYAQGPLLFGACGAVGALAFWLVWRLGNPAIRDTSQNCDAS